jgi:glutamyl-tRNA reductase
MTRCLGVLSFDVLMSDKRSMHLGVQEGRIQFDIRLMRDLLPCVEDADVIFAASGSEELLVHASDVAAMRPAGEGVGGVRRFFDISVPRNIDPKIDELDTAGVWNVDDLQEV